MNMPNVHWMTLIVALVIGLIFLCIYHKVVR